MMNSWEIEEVLQKVGYEIDVVGQYEGQKNFIIDSVINMKQIEAESLAKSIRWAYKETGNMV